MIDNVIKGTPSPVFIEAKPWAWKHVSGPHAIEIKNNAVLKTNEAVGFPVCGFIFNEETDIDVRVDLGVITKVLFAEKKYPSLKENQVFTINNVMVDRANNMVTVVGNVIEKI